MNPVFFTRKETAGICRRSLYAQVAPSGAPNQLPGPGGSASWALRRFKMRLIFFLRIR